ncbi:MAG: endonuclease/exonuclease/phosphatase family protein [Duncaniella sp.]|nr:endonuclease/exonuclease/phosphatase family protein [Duncaniella sp.]
MATVRAFFSNLFRRFHSTIRAVTVGVNGIVFLATVFSAYGGWFDPARVPVAALAAMILPALLVGGIVLMIIDCFISYRVAVMILASWLISMPEILIFFPLNIFSEKLTPEQEARTFTLLTYNCLHLHNYAPTDSMTTNGTASYILATDADVVNLQELEFLSPRKSVHLTSEQVDSLKSRYPYRVIDAGQQLSVLSKFPVEPIHITIPKRSSPCLIGAYRLDINGTTVNLYNVHLKSIGLSTDDKTLYRELPGKIKETEGAELREEIRDVKQQLVSKLAQSFAVRGIEARWLREVIDSIGGNTIVAGDFNDIPGCHAQRVIMNGDLHDAYADNAFGAVITYHDNRFYFRIDHILYGGDLKAVDIRRDTPPWSDHYPLFTRVRF